jgi:tetratricopeptide (TPR) repeat protein
LITVVLALCFLAGQSGPPGQSNFEAQFVAGLNALNRLDLPAAQEGLLAASRLQPANPRVWVALSQTYLRMGKTALAGDAAGKAERFGGDDPVTLRLLAVFYAERNQFARAGDIEVRCAAKDRQDSMATARAMADYLQADQPRKAIDLALATAGWEGRADIRNLLGKAYEADGQILKTIPELEEAIRLQPGEESYYFDLVQVLVGHYNFDAAIRIGEAARKRFPASAPLALLTGVACYGQNQPDAAIDALLEAVALDPSAEQPYLILARLIDQAHDRLPAITQRFVDYQEKNPQSYLGYFLHAKALNAEFREPENTEELLRKSVALNGKYWESHYELGILLAKRGALGEAEKEFRRSVELNPKDPAAHYRLFRVLAGLGKTEEAQAELAVQRKVSAESQADLNRQLGSVKRLEISITDPAKQAR